MTEPRPRKGVKTKLMGVVLVFLGLMDSMLSWRGGVELSDFYLLLIAAGLGLYLVGSIRDASEMRRRVT